MTREMTVPRKQRLGPLVAAAAVLALTGGATALLARLDRTRAAERAAEEAQAAALRAAAQFRAATEMQKAGAIYRDNPALLRLEELRALRELAQNANARIYIGFDKHAADKPAG